MLHSSSKVSGAEPQILPGQFVMGRHDIEELASSQLGAGDGDALYRVVVTDVSLCNTPC